MSKDRAVVGTDGTLLQVLPPKRDARVWARLVCIMFYLPGFMALLLIKSGEPAGFGISVELLTLSGAAAPVGGLFIGTDSSGLGADSSSKIGIWSGSLVLELLAVVPFLCAIPSLFHELASIALLHARLPGTVDVALGASELLPMIAIFVFMLYQLAGFGTLKFVIPRTAIWIVNLVILGLIIGSYIGNREGVFFWERRCASVLVLLMAILTIYGVLKLKYMQESYDLLVPPKLSK